MLKLKKVSGASSNKSGFGEVNPDRLREKIANLGQSNRIFHIKRDFTLYTKKEGKSFLRVIPPAAGFADFSYEVYVHEFVGPNGDYFVCAQQMKTGECELCNLHKEAKNINLEEMPAQQKKSWEEYIRKLKPSRKILYWVLDVSEKPQTDTPLLLEAPATLGDAILRLCMHPKTGGVEPITDPKEGREVYFLKRKKPNSKQWEYVDVQLGDEHPITSELAEYIVPFEDVLVEPDEDAVAEVAKYYANGPVQSASKFGKEKEKDTSDEEGEVPPKKKFSSGGIGNSGSAKPVSKIKF